MELIKNTIRVGNSAGVLLPKEFLNTQVKIVLQPLNIEKDILDILNEKKLLPKVLGVYLVGSYARGEQTIESDVDVLVITENVNNKIKKARYDIILIQEESIKKQLERNILPLLPMLIESKSILNTSLIESYKKTRLTKENLNFHIETTKSAMGVIDASIKLSREMGIEESDASAYSLILRLRGIYIVDCLKKGRLWNKKEFLGMIKRIAGSLKAYEGYLRTKSDKKTEDKLPLKEAEKLYNYIIKKIKEQEEWIKNEAKKKTGKRNRVP